MNDSINKERFALAKQNGINSFKLISVHKDMKLIINQVNKECLERLQFGPDINGIHKKGLSIAIEAPKCCNNYASMNVDRAVPIRQYFGKSHTKETNLSRKYRYSYGIGSGSSTVGGDVETTKTKPLTKCMKKMCRELTKVKEINCFKDKNNNVVDFNHVTILYYMPNMKGNNPIIELKPHCDLEVTASNKVKVNNSQKEGTPTVVLALKCKKDVTFYKRYSNGKKFEDGRGTKVDSMTMNHGDLFILHPKDERVFKRRIWNTELHEYQNETKSSQFKHGVVVRRKKNKQRLSISVCFRQVKQIQQYSRNNTLIDAQGVECKNDVRTEAMQKREERIAKKRNNIKNTANIERIRKRMMTIYNECSDISSLRRKK